MAGWMTAIPVAPPQLIAAAIGFLCFALSPLLARTPSGSAPGEAGVKRSMVSRIGIVVQGFAIFVVLFGRVDVSADPLALVSLASTVAVLALMLGAAGLFAASKRALGANWSLAARTRDDHRLVTTGPFEAVRHPIYSALFLVMLGFALASGHLRHLLLSVPLFALGTWLRIGEEERLLRAMFGAASEGTTCP